MNRVIVQCIRVFLVSTWILDVSSAIAQDNGCDWLVDRFGFSGKMKKSTEEEDKCQYEQWYQDTKICRAYVQSCAATESRLRMQVEVCCWPKWALFPLKWWVPTCEALFVEGHLYPLSDQPYARKGTREFFFADANDCQGALRAQMRAPGEEYLGTLIEHMDLQSRTKTTANEENVFLLHLICIEGACYKFQELDNSAAYAPLKKQY